MERLKFAVPLLVAFACGASPALSEPLLGTAANFAVLGASTVTNDPTAGETTLWGDLGVYDGTAITGQESITINGQPALTTGAVFVHAGDAVAQQAQADALNAYNALAGMPETDNLTGDDLGGLTLPPGVYSFDTTAQLTGTLTLNFLGDPNALFVFQIGTALTTASGAVVDVINGISDDADYGVYWLMGVTGGSGTGSATLNSSTVFAGNILALDSITLGSTASILCGRAIALNAAVTMINNVISNDCVAFAGDENDRTDFGSFGFSGSGNGNGNGNGNGQVPEPATLALLGIGLLGLVLRLRRLAH